MANRHDKRKGAPFFRLKCLIPVLATILAATLHLAAPAAHAATAALSWSAPTTNTDGSTLSDLAGYKVYVGTSPGSYQSGIDVGNQTSYNLSNLTDGATYYFAVTAYNSAKVESALSNETSKATAATGFTITASAGSGGTITALNNTSVSSASNGSTLITSVNVAAGASQSFSIAPASGYTISSVTVDGASVGAPTSYTFTGVNASHTIAATFAASSVSGTTGGTSTGTTTAAVFAANSGGSQYTDTSGTSYGTDTRYSGGSAASAASTVSISGTSDPTLYRSERYGNFSYAIPVTNGNYNVTLKFAEIYWGSAGQRVFNVAINGTTVISNLDIYAKVGKNAAYDVTIPVSVTNGAINITFTTVKDAAKVSAIAVRPATTTGTTGTTSGATVFAANSGGSQYTSASGTSYMTDTRYSGGSAASAASTVSISGTSDPTLYRSERYGNFSYAIPAVNGNYAVTLKFAEIYWGAAGQRVFNVAINGTPVISNLDIYAKVGKNAAYDVIVPVSVTNGAINITFTTVKDAAKVSAILVQTK